MKSLERKISDFTEVKNVFLTGSGTNALICTLKALRLPLGSEVVIPSYVCFSVPIAVYLSGLKPIIADVSVDDYNIDPKSVKELINEKTSAIVAVHTFGNSCRIDEIRYIADINNLQLIEDFCHSFNGSYKGKKHGSFGNVAITSFSSRKLFNVGGGAIVTDNDQIFNRVKSIVSGWDNQDQSLDLERIRSHLEDSFLPKIADKTGYNANLLLPYFFNLIYKFRPSLFLYDFSLSWSQNLNEEFDNFKKRNEIREKNIDFFSSYIDTENVKGVSRIRKSGTSMYYSLLLKKSRRKFKAACLKLHPDLIKENVIRFAYSASHFSKFNQEPEFSNSELVRTRIVNIVISNSRHRKTLEIVIKLNRVLSIL